MTEVEKVKILFSLFIFTTKLWVNGRQLLAYLPTNSTSWYSVFMESRGAWAEPNDSLVMNSKWQTWWNTTSVFGLLAFCFLHSLLWLPYCELLCGKASMAGNWGKSPASSSGELRHESNNLLRSESCQLPRKWAWKWVLPIGSWDDPSPPWVTLRAGVLTEVEPGFLIQRNWEIISVVVSPRHFGVICYIITDN